MENKTMIELVGDLKEVVSGQVQVRTNKLKPLVEAMESKASEEQSEVEFLNAIKFTKENYGITTHEALQTIEEKFKNKDPDIDIDLESQDSEEKTPEEVASENRYLKRKLTMYELKIGKRDATIKEQDEAIKGYKKGVQATIFDV